MKKWAKMNEDEKLFLVISRAFILVFLIAVWYFLGTLAVFVAGAIIAFLAKRAGLRY